MLEWADVLKFLTGVATALIGIWAKRHYDLAKEREALEQSLLCGFRKESLTCGEAIRLLSGAVQDINAGKGVILYLGVPKAFTQTAERLATLDPARAHFYLDYVAHVGFLDDALRQYGQLVHAYHTSPSSSQRLMDAITAAARLSARALLALDRTRHALVSSSGWSLETCPTDDDVRHVSEAVADGELALAQAGPILQITQCERSK